MSVAWTDPANVMAAAIDRAHPGLGHRLLRDIDTQREAARISAELAELGDPRIQVDPDPDWVQFGACDLCGMTDCAGDTAVTWTTARATRDQTYRVGRGHLVGWVGGFVTVDAGDHDMWDEPILIKVGGGLT